MSSFAVTTPMPDTIADGAVRTSCQIRAVIDEFADIGMTDLVLTPTLADLDEVDRLAEIVS